MSANTATRRPFAGFGNQLRHEAGTWWRRGRLVRRALAWTVSLAGLFALMHWALPAVLPADAGLPETDIAQSARQFTELAAIVTAIGTVLATQGLLLDERRSGVIEWLLSKPLTWPALLTAKFVGNTAGLAIAAVAAPWIAVSGLVAIAGAEWSPTRTLVVVAMFAVLVGFHVALVLIISAFGDRRGAVIGLPLSLVVGSDFVAAAFPALFAYLPWSIGRIAGTLLADGIVVTVTPLLSALAATLVLLAATAMRPPLDP